MPVLPAAAAATAAAARFTARWALRRRKKKGKGFPSWIAEGRIHSAASVQRKEAIPPLRENSLNPYSEKWLEQGLGMSHFSLHQDNIKYQLMIKTQT